MLSVANELEPNSTIPYHLARYCARPGQTDQAKRWPGKALVVAVGMVEVQRLREMALEDPDLKPLKKMP